MNEKMNKSANLSLAGLAVNKPWVTIVHPAVTGRSESPFEITLIA
jgi:hypothetical protein